MDPTVALQNALALLNDNERDNAVDALRELADWLSRGGCLPDVAEAIRVFENQQVTHAQC